MAGLGCDDCRFRCGKGRVPPDIAGKITRAYNRLATNDSNSLVKKYLTEETYKRLKDLSTPLGANLLDCIQSGAAFLDSGIGLYAPDAEAYTVFQELFLPVIIHYHLCENKNHPPECWGDPCAFSNLDPSNKYIISTRIRTGRSVKGYPFTPKMSEDDFKEVEQKLSVALSSMQGVHQGVYYPLKLMAKSETARLIEEHYMFKERDKYLEAANIMRHWPTGRGIFYNADKTFLAWINEEDHLRVISMEQGANFMAVYKRLKDAMEYLENYVEFARSDKFGYLTACPTNIGTSIRASVHITLPRLGANRPQLEEIADKLNLQVRGACGEHTESTDTIFDISNKRRLGINEFNVMKEMYDGIQTLIGLEECADEE